MPILRPTNLVVAATALLAFASGLPECLAQVSDGHYIVSNWAGSAGVFGIADGIGTSARFSLVYGVALDASGNLYVADTSYNTIRKINAGGAVTTLAGLPGASGNADGTGSSARFNSPTAIAVDSTGSLYVVDTNNHTIRKITPAGAVSTLAGSPGLIGSADGIGSSARFNSPNAIAVDANGNVYVADTNNHTIRKITAGGTVTTLAGVAGAGGYADGTGSAARFNLPYGITATPAGALYVADTYNQRIRKITADATVTTVAGDGTAGAVDGVAAGARFNAPRGIAVDAAENLFVADEFNDTIRKIIPGGTVSTLAGVAGAIGSADGGGRIARFNRAAAIAVNASGKLYIGDTQNYTIRRAIPPPSNSPLLDQSFNAGEFNNGDVQRALLQPDGKLLILGGFNKVHGIVRHHLARLNPDGTLDPTFDAGDGPDYSPSGMLLQNDGKLVIYGNFAAVNGVSRAANIARLNSDGSLDVAFDPGQYITNGSGPGSVYTAVLQESGKLVVAGVFSRITLAPGNEVPRSCVARFNGDGSFDPSFDPGTGFGYDPTVYIPIIYHAVRQQNGPDRDKIVFAGIFDSFNGNPIQQFARLNADGSFDSSFTSPGLVGTGNFFDINQVLALYAQSDDRIVVHGSFTLFAGAARSGIVRFNSSGAVDLGFNPAPFARYGATPVIVSGVAQQSDGKLIVGGYFHSLGISAAHCVVRLQPNGSVDTSFDSSVAAGPYATDAAALCVRPDDGHIFIGGNFSTYGGLPRGNIAWVDPTGSADPQFASLSGVTNFDPQIYALATQPDGKILAGGFFNSFGGVPHYNLVRLNPDSTIDPTFSQNFQCESSVRTIALQPDGKILIGGNIRAVNGVAVGRIARLNSDGSIDNSFNSGTGADSTVYAIALDPSGNVFVGGSFQNFNGVSRRRFAKLTPNGALDSTFNPGTAAGSTVYAIAPIDSSGLVIGGIFTSFNGTTARRIARVNAITGALDTSFNSGGSGFDSTVYALTRGSDGKYYVVGAFSAFNNVPRLRVARLNGDGSLDTSFVGGPLGGSEFHSVALLPGGRLLAGGSDRNTNTPLLVRLTSDGALDGTFNIGSGVQISPDNALDRLSLRLVSALTIQADGRPLIGGIFNQVNGTARSCLARLTTQPIAFTSLGRLQHGSMGFFDVDLPLSGLPGVECRNIASNFYNVVFTFVDPVTTSGATVTAGAGSVASTSMNGNQVTVNLTGVTNAQRLTLTLFGVNNGTTTSDLNTPVGVLLGDTTGNGTVNASDIGQTKSFSGQTADPTNFRSDVNLSGSVNASDIGQVKAMAGTSLPP